jgi:hypothetical protein
VVVRVVGVVGREPRGTCWLERKWTRRNVVVVVVRDVVLLVVLLLLLVLVLVLVKAAAVSCSTRTIVPSIKARKMSVDSSSTKEVQ